MCVLRAGDGVLGQRASLYSTQLFLCPVIFGAQVAMPLLRILSQQLQGELRILKSCCWSVLLACGLLLGLHCSPRLALADAPGAPDIGSYEPCVKAGNSSVISLSTSCRTDAGQLLVADAGTLGAQATKLPEIESPAAGIEGELQQPSSDGNSGPRRFCKDKCGDGVCQEVVCMAIGCPCAETPASCPADCKK